MGRAFGTGASRLSDLGLDLGLWWILVGNSVCIRIVGLCRTFGLRRILGLCAGYLVCIGSLIGAGCLVCVGSFGMCRIFGP